MSINNQLKIKIAKLREKLSLTQLEVAQKVGVRESTIANWENGRSGVQWLVRLVKLCECLNCKPQDLFEYIGFEPEEELLDEFQGKCDNFTKSNLEQRQEQSDNCKNRKSIPETIEKFQGKGHSFIEGDLKQWQGQGNTSNKNEEFFSVPSEVTTNEISEKFKEQKG